MAAINPDRARGTVHLRQRIVCLVAAVAFLLAAAAPGAWPLGAIGIVLAALAIPQWRGRAPVAWIGPALRYAARARHSYAAEGLFRLVAPEATVTPVEVSGAEIGAIADRDGLAAIIELGDPEALLVTGGLALPMPAELAGSPSADEPTIATQVLVVRRSHFQRVFVAVRVGGDGVAWTDAQLRQALSGAVRGVVRRLARIGPPGRALSVTGARAAIAWAVNGTADGDADERKSTGGRHAIGATNEVFTGATTRIATIGVANGAARFGPASEIAAVDERWDHLRIDSALHVTVRIAQRPERLTTDVIARLVETPASLIALSIAPEGLLVRLSAATPALLAAVVASVMATCPTAVTHMDGEQRAGLAATLPLGVVDPAGVGPHVDASRPRRSRVDDQFASPSRPVAASGPHVTAAPPTLPDAGLLLGRDRRGAPVYLQLGPDRTTPLRVAVIGGPAAPRVLSARLRSLGELPGGPHAVPVAMAVFEHVTPADGATLASADVVVCQPVSQPEAALVASALRLTRAGAWLSRIEGDMIAIISHGAVRWAQLSAHTGDGRRFTGLSGLAGSART